MKDPCERQVRDLVYETLAAEGRAPSTGELARLTSSSAEDVLGALRSLAEQHVLVLNEDRDAVRMAHPFTAAPMAFVVTPLDGTDDRRWWGGCAWDSFGISAALDLEVVIDTACPQCGAHLSYRAGPRTAPPADLAVRFPRPAREWWSDVVGTCTMIRTFCHASHAEEWTSRHAPGEGYITPVTAVWRLATPWYGDRLAVDFEPHPRDHNQRLLADCGFVGSFWELP